MSKPWEDNADWQPPFRSNAKKQMTTLWVFTFLRNAISIPLLFVLPGEVEKANYAALAGLMFPMNGARMIYWAVNLSKEFFKYGVTELHLDPYPGSIGGQVGGKVVLSGQAGVEPQYSASLICMRSFIIRSGGKNKRRQEEVWQATGPAKAISSAQGVELSFRFDVPDELPQSEAPSREYHFWKIVLESDHENTALNRAFEIPVFSTQQNSTYITTDSAALAVEKAQADVEGALTSATAAQTLKKRLGLSLEVRADWVRLYFHQ